MARWTTADMPSQRGRIAVVTGAGGLGLEDATALARAHGQVVLAGRNARKGAAAVKRILDAAPDADVSFELLDLASLESVAAFAARLRDRTDRLDLLINNAGIMVPPTRQETRDGFELQFGTNHLGHVALTAGLMPLLRAGRDARVVTLSSVAARQGAIDFANLNAERRYDAMKAYSQSKLACLMFALEFQRRSVASGWGVTAIASHPGIARTDLLHNAPGQFSLVGIARSLLWFMFQPAANGSLPTLFAATAPEAQPGGYYGPDGFGETRGNPAPARIPAAALDEAVASRLWTESERLARVTF